MKAVITIGEHSYEAKYNICQGIHGFVESSGLRAAYMEMERDMESLASRAMTSPSMTCQAVMGGGKTVHIRLSA